MSIRQLRVRAEEQFILQDLHKTAIKDLLRSLYQCCNRAYYVTFSKSYGNAIHMITQTYVKLC